MTKLTNGKSVTREVPVLIRHRPVVAALGARTISLKPKGLGRGHEVVVDLEAVYMLGMQQRARAERAERLAAKKARRARA